jgi:hypothetical protein
MMLLDAMYAAWIVTVAPRSFEATESGPRKYASSICQCAGAGAVKEINLELNERATNDSFFS